MGYYHYCSESIAIEYEFRIPWIIKRRALRWIRQLRRELRAMPDAECNLIQGNSVISR